MTPDPARTSLRTDVTPMPAERIRACVEQAVARLCQDGTSPERVRQAVDSATERASETCGRWGCGACGRLWAEPGLSCEARRLRILVKRIAMALLPMVRRGCALDVLRATLEEAVVRAWGGGSLSKPAESRPLSRTA